MSKNKNKIEMPMMSWDINFFESLIDNSGLSVTNSWIAAFYRRYFYNKIYSIINIEGLPKSIDERFFKNNLLTRGHIGVFDTLDMGVIANNMAIYDYDIYYNPTKAEGINPLFTTTYQRDIKYLVNAEYKKENYQDCAIIKLSPNWETVLPIINYYADLMSVAIQGIDSNVLNSKLAYVFACENQTVASSFKKMFDDITNGCGAVFADKKLFDDEGGLKMEMFNTNVSNTFIADKLMALKVDIENEFNSFIGLTAVNTEKKERLITSEVELSNNNNRILIELWSDTINDTLEVCNILFDTDIKCNLNINYIDSNNEHAGGDADVSDEA